jgi:hypothetical protein
VDIAVIHYTSSITIFRMGPFGALFLGNDIPVYTNFKILNIHLPEKLVKSYATDGFTEHSIF